ncbi:MAG: hypothetical protein K2R98_33105 [Gemmataceae bacterium]|nr:hypothetical protein [Gemmataceae bacterium]
MPLQLTSTWEHALLAATAQSAMESGDAVYLGRTALQKILYFLQISGVPMRYRFDIYHYGPYCDRITRDVQLLLADDVLRDASQCPEKYSNYRPGSDTEGLLRSHQSTLNQHQATIKKVVRSLLPLQPDHLELMATLNYLYRQIKAGGGHGPWKERVIERFMQVKKDKFTREAVSEAYDSMIRANLLDA